MNLENIINSGKRIFEISLLVGVLTAIPFLEGCVKSKDNQKSNQNNQVAIGVGLQAPGISEKLQEQWPIWKLTDLEINKYEGPALSYTTEFNIKPDFYRGSMPIKYDFTQTLGGANHIINHKFKNFSNYFIYGGLNLIGAVSVNNNNKMVAEARITYYNDGVWLKPKVEEFHYANGLLVYHCMSKVDINNGIKTEESECSGKKQNEYFFILPFGINAGMPR